MKLLIQPIDKKHLKQLSNMNIDGYIIGLKKYSIFQPLKMSVGGIKKIKTNKELYISINKPIHNNEIEEIKKILIELSKLNIKGVLFEDIAILNINNDLNLKLNLIWNQMHLSTNSDTCNYWNKRGSIGAFLSTELMLSDFINIKKNTNMILMVYMYGYMPMFESSRILVTNYLRFIKKLKLNKLYYLYEKDRNTYYPIYEEYNNTFILDDILNGINCIKDLKDNNIDYIVLNGLLHNKKNFNNIINDYINVLDDKELNIRNVNTGFLFKESIFRVKE